MCVCTSVESPLRSYTFLAYACLEREREREVYDFFPIRNIDSYLAPTISDCVVYVAAGKQVLTASGSKHTGMLWVFFFGGGGLI